MSRKRSDATFFLEKSMSRKSSDKNLNPSDSIAISNLMGGQKTEGYNSKGPSSSRISDIHSNDPPKNSKLSLHNLLSPAVQSDIFASSEDVIQAGANTPSEEVISDTEDNNDQEQTTSLIDQGDEDPDIEAEKDEKSVTDFLPLDLTQNYVSFSTRNGNKMVLRFRQQPQGSRMIGFGEKDRRPIDPPPILELIYLNSTGERIVGADFCHDFVACASLFCKDGRLNRSHVRQTRHEGYRLDWNKIYNSLAGETDANCQVLFDENGRKSNFFIFPQLSVRIKGEFRLKFVIVNPREAERSPNGHVPIIAEIMSEPFIVYTIKNFPGVTKTTELSNLIKNQGIRFNSRRFGSADRQTEN